MLPPRVAIVNLTAEERVQLARTFAVCLLRRDVSLLSYENRVDFSLRMANLSTLIGGPPRFLRIGPSTWIKPALVNELRREFSPASVEKVKRYDEIPAFLKSQYPALSIVDVAAPLTGLLQGKRLLLVCEASEAVVASALVQSLKLEGFVETLVVKPGTKVNQWQSDLFALSGEIGAIVYAYGISLGKSNLPKTLPRRILIWRDFDMIDSMRRLYQACMKCYSDEQVTASESAD